MTVLALDLNTISEIFLTFLSSGCVTKLKFTNYSGVKYSAQPGPFMALLIIIKVLLKYGDKSLRNSVYQLN